MLHAIHTRQFLKSDIQTVWDFMSAPENLAKITPAHMGFHILGEMKQTKMYPGQIIEYYVRPVLGIRMHWVTEITHVKEGEYFVDEQRSGPYRIWHHKHFLKETDGGVEMTDIVHYQAPLGFIGRIVNHLLIRKQLRQIFDYRYQRLEEIFNHS